MNSGTFSSSSSFHYFNHFLSRSTCLRSSIGSYLLNSICHPRKMTTSSTWKKSSTIRRYIPVVLDVLVHVFTLKCLATLAWTKTSMLSLSHDSSKLSSHIYLSFLKIFIERSSSNKLVGNFLSPRNQQFTHRVLALLLWPKLQRFPSYADRCCSGGARSLD
jgi:hypothetical protein